MRISCMEEQIKKIFESENIEKYGHNLIEDYVILRQNGIMFKNMVFDIEIAAYLVNPTNSKYNISILANQYLNIDMNDYLENMGIDKNQNKQITLFETQELNDTTKYENGIETYLLNKLIEKITEKLKK